MPERMCDRLVDLLGDGGDAMAAIDAMLRECGIGIDDPARYIRESGRLAAELIAAAMEIARLRREAQQIARVCQYCHQAIGRANERLPTSHGICSPCLDKHHPECPEDSDPTLW